MLPRRPGQAIVFLSLGLTLALYLLAKPTLGSLSASPLLAVAQVTALFGVVLFAFSFLLASRTYLVEESFGGLDKAYRFHHQIGKWSFILLAAHFAAIAANAVAGRLPLARLMTGSAAYIFGEIGLIGMAAIVLTIIFAKIKYQYFVFIQKLFILPYAFGVWHLAVVSSDVSRYAPLRIFIVGISVLGAAAWLYREFFYGTLGPRGSYAVKSVEDKGAGIVEISLEPKGRPLAWLPGQFAYFSFRSGAVPKEPHPFSISSAPGSSELRFAAKALGDYTSTLKLAKPGDEVTVFGPYGKFLESLGPAGASIFVAGGIGVTPFLSVLRQPAACSGAVVFYATKSDADCPYHEELSALSCGAQPFHYHFHDSDRRGYLSADIIEKRAGGLGGKTVYLCGPAPMMRSLTDGLLAKGVPKSRIVFENFSY